MPVTQNLWGDSAKALVGALYGDPEKAAALESDRASAGLNLEKTRGEQMKNNALIGLDDTLNALGSDPESYNQNLAAALGGLGRAGVTAPGNYLTPFLAGRAMIAPEAQADTMGRGAIITSGSSPSESFAATSSRADRISARDAGEETGRALAVERARPRTLDQMLGARFDTLPEEQQTLAAQLKAFGEITPRNITFTGPDGNPAQRIGVGPGYFDDQGSFTMPQGNAAIYSAQTEATTPGMATGYAGLTDTVTNGVQKNLISRNEAINIADGMMERVSGQTTGIIPFLLDQKPVGIANQLVPGAVDQALSYLPGEYNVDQIKIDRGLLRLDIQRLGQSLINEDGKRSDKDQALMVKLGAALEPDVTDEVARATIKAAVEDWKREADVSRDLLQNGINLGGAPEITAAPQMPKPMSIQEYQALPPGTQYIDPDTGEVVTKGQ